MYLLPETTGSVENVIGFIKDSEGATVTFFQGRHKGRIRKPAADHLGECQIVAENTDGSMCARIPIAWIKINPTYQLTEEQRGQRAETMRRNFQI